MPLLWILIIVLILGWGGGLALGVGGGLIHLLLVIAVIAIIFQLISGRRVL